MTTTAEWKQRLADPDVFFLGRQAELAMLERIEQLEAALTTALLAPDKQHWIGVAQDALRGRAEHANAT